MRGYRIPTLIPVLLCTLVLLPPPGAAQEAPETPLEAPPAETAQPEAMETILEVSPTGYRIGSEDIVDIRVYGEPELTAVARVSSEGLIVLPLIGTLSAAGLTTEELTHKITAMYKKGYLKRPQVMVLLQQYRQTMVHIMGEVSAPGPYRLTHQNTLIELISKAGGFTPVAKRSEVRIIRPGREGENVIHIDAAKIIDDGRLDLDVLLQPGDLVVVAERFF